MNDGSSVEIRLHFPSQGKVKIEMSVPSGRRRAKLHLSLAFDYSNLHNRKEKDRNNKCCFGHFGPSVEIRLHFCPMGKNYCVAGALTRRAIVHRTIAFILIFN